MRNNRKKNFLNNTKHKGLKMPEHNKLEFPQEKKRLLGLLDEEVWVVLEDAGAFIAGGAITSLFTNREINDLDVYFPSEEKLLQAVHLMYGVSESPYVPEECMIDLDYGTMFAHCMTNKSILYRAAFEQDVQFMHFQYFDSPVDIFDKFDFTCCMGLYEIGKGEFTLHPDFMKHNSQNHLKYNPDTAFPLISLMRVRKYSDKGYDISKPELLRIALSCANLTIENWEDAANQCGGMYGYSMETIFDTNKEFSLEEVIRQLGNLELNNSYAEYAHEDLDVQDIVERITGEKYLGECKRLKSSLPFPIGRG
jgi:hypothetical protein